MAKEDIITADYIRSILHYDPETGAFTWLDRLDIPSNINSRTRGKTAGSVNWAGYTRIKICKTEIFAHRIAWIYMTGKWPKNQIDHINGIVSDNRICNLREATNSQNQQNRKLDCDNSTGIQGVGRDNSNNKFIAYITIDNKRHNLGRFSSIHDAEKIRLDAKRKMHTFNPKNST